MEAQNLSNTCIKTLSKSELFDQREFNGVNALKMLMGLDDKDITAKFILRGENLSSIVAVKWYDARSSHETRSEFRFYYEKNPVMQEAQAGDNIVIGLDKNKLLTCILFKKTNKEHQGNIQEWKSL